MERKIKTTVAEHSLEIELSLSWVDRANIVCTINTTLEKEKDVNRKAREFSYESIDLDIQEPWRIIQDYSQGTENSSKM